MAKKYTHCSHQYLKTCSDNDYQVQVYFIVFDRSWIFQNDLQLQWWGKFPQGKKELIATWYSFNMINAAPC